ncbi:MAG TPA: hypothetical protein VFS62_14950, partial [Chloroflexota bacterium]|nr:hypothetical protein [Chloroflexota bacterium]
MCDFAVKLTRTPYEITREDVDALCQAGFSESDAWDIAEVTAEFNFSNRMASATGMMPNAEYYAVSPSPAAAGEGKGEGPAAGH